LSPPPVKLVSAGKFTFWMPDSGSDVVAETVKLLDVPVAPL
jgi:hypothetical protein